MVLEPFGPVVVDKLPSETEKRECRLSAGRAMNPEPQTLKAAKALKPKRQKAPQKTKKVQNKPEPVPFKCLGNQVAPLSSRYWLLGCSSELV